MSNNDDKLSIHTQAVNLARRFSVQNENDLMQEDLYNDTMDIPEKTYDRDTCKELAKHLVHYKSLPTACLKYKDIASDLKRRETDTTDATQILS